MSLTELHALLGSAALRRHGPAARVGLLSLTPGRWTAWVELHDADRCEASTADTPETALKRLLAEINAANVADCDAASTRSARVFRRQGLDAPCGEQVSL